MLSSTDTLADPLAPHLRVDTHGKDFKMPELKPFNHAIDNPVTHLMNFKGQLTLYEINEPLMCKLFKGTLRYSALYW